MGTVTSSPRRGILAAALGREIRVRRLELDMTQEQLAAAAFITQDLVSRLEMGVLPRDPAVLDRISIALGGELWADLDLFRVFRHGATIEARNHDDEGAS
jgi:transcriptional regulator with XRE-family HTH domain